MSYFEYHFRKKKFRGERSYGVLLLINVFSDINLLNALTIDFLKNLFFDPIFDLEIFENPKNLDMEAYGLEK